MNADRLTIRPTIQRLLPQVTTKPGLLHTSEWRVRMKIAPAIDSDLASFNCRCDSVRTADVIGKDGGAEPVF